MDASSTRIAPAGGSDTNGRCFTSPLCAHMAMSKQMFSVPNSRSIDSEKLVEGVKEECSLCTVIWEAIRSCTKVKTLRSLLYNTRWVRIRPSRKEGARFVIEARLGWYRTKLLELEVYIIAAALNQTHGITGNQTWPPVHHIPLEADTDASFKTVNDWVEACTRMHPLCSDPPSYFPTRVLDVGDERVRLYESRRSEWKQSGQLPKYAALSHCWGKGMMLITTRETLDERKNDIGWTSLPKSFQDAITITRRLGLRYLWIDSLCILQRDKDDWEREAFRMRDVYSQAWVTLAATWSDSSAKGCFSNRDNGTTPIRLSDEEPQFFTRFQLSHDRNNSNLSWREPLLTRAWTLQEHFLSRRVIHYTKQEIVWECRMGSACECTPRLVYSRKNLSNTEKLFSIASPLSHTDISGREENVWRDIVGEYTSRHLTFGTDKRPAIAGLANWLSSIEAAQRKEHVACLLWSPDASLYAEAWRPTLQQLERDGMNWYNATHLFVKQNVNPQKYTFRFRAPTWSWLSVEGPISYDYVPLDKLAAAKINCSIRAEDGSDITSDLRIATQPLRIRGALVAGQLRIRTATTHKQGHQRIFPWGKGERTISGEEMTNTIWLGGLLYKNGCECAFDPDVCRFSRAFVANPLHFTRKCAFWRRFQPLEDVFCLELVSNLVVEKPLRRKNNKRDLNHPHLYKSVKEQPGSVALILTKSRTRIDAYERIGIGFFHEATCWFKDASTSEVLVV